MRNKKLLYILVPAVFIVWGIIAYKIISGLHKDDMALPQEKIFDKRQSEKDTAIFQLLENYNDPFLGTGYSDENATVAKKVVKDNSAPVDFLALQEANETWSKINYGGLIEGQGKTDMLGLLSFEGKSYLLGRNQRIGNIEIVAMYSDSVKLCFKGFFKTVLKKK